MIVKIDKIRILSLAVLAVMAVISCNKPDGGSSQQKPDPAPTPTPTPTPSIVIDSGVDTKPIFGEDGGDFKISFESSVSWTASVVATKADLSWVTLDRTSGPAGHVSIGVKVSANETYSARSAIVRIVAGSKMQDITITQRAKEDKTVKVTSISLRVDGSPEISIGESVTIIATVLPDNATNKNVIWSSGNADVATVKDGVVTGISEGSAYIKVTSEDGGASTGCWISVDDPITHVSYVSIEYIERSVIGIGETSVLTVHVYPEDATNKNVIWTSSNDNVASVADGVVTGISAGTAEIIVTAEDGGASATCTISVEIPVESLTFDITSATLNVGETLTIKATVLPEDATNKDIYWYSVNTEIATVEDGVVTALKQGNVWIMAQCGGAYNNCFVRVVDPNLVSFNDWQFKQFCVENFDLDNDGEISLDEAAAVKEIDYTTPNWVNLSDIKYFVNLESLKVISTVTDGYYTLEGHGAISELNKLKHLEIVHFGLYIGSFNISGLADLEYLDIHDSYLSFLDVSKNKKLKYLDCSPMMYDTLYAIAVYKGQNIPNVTVDRNPDYIPPYTKIYVEGSVVAGGNEGTREGDEI